MLNKPGSAGGQDGRNFERSEKLLREQLAAKPDDRNARIALLELYYHAGREQDFLREARILRESLRGNLDSPDWRMIASIGRALAPASPLFADTADRIPFTTEPARPPEKKYRRLGETREQRKQFEALVPLYEAARADPKFIDAIDRELLQIGGRPSSMFHAERLSRHIGGAQIYVKREDLSASGVNLMMAVVGQAMLAKRLGRKTLVAGTIYGQKGVMTASIAARLGLEAVIYMDGADIHKHSANVFRMWVTNATVESVDARELPGQDVREAAVRHWMRQPQDCFLMLGLDAGPEPYPTMGRDFASAVGRECRRQVMSMARRMPDVVVARGHSCADAIGLFPPLMPDARVRLVCVDSSSTLEARSEPRKPGDPYNPLEQQLTEQQKRLADAILEGLEYPSVTREHQWLEASGRVEYVSASPEEAKRAIRNFGTLEGIVPAIQSAHAIAWACRTAATMKPDQVVVVHLNERVEKDIWDIGKALGMHF